MKKLLFATVLIGLVTVACDNKPEETVVDKAGIAAEVEKTFEAYVRQVNTDGIVYADTFFANDDAFYWIEDGVVQYPDKAALTEGIRQFAPAVESLNMQASAVQCEAINNEHAMLFVQYTEEIKLKSGFVIPLDGAMTILMQRKKGGWKFLNGHSSVKKTRQTNPS